MRILFFGDGAWATNSLHLLAQDGWALVGLVARTRPTDPALVPAAEALGLPIFRPPKVNAPDFVVQVRALQPELNLSVSYDQILHRPILETAPRGFVNFHAGRLPYYRGRNVVNWAIINGETEIGLTAHYMDDGVDTGDIILQRTLPIGWTDTYGDVLRNVVAAFPGLVAETVRLIASGRAPRRPQAHLPGTYVPRRQEGDEWLDWSDTSRNLHNKVRAITRPGPGARTLLGDRPVIIWRAFYDASWPIYIATPGRVVGCRPGEGVLVKTGDSSLLVQEVQVGDEAAHVPAWPVGTRLGINLVPCVRELQARVRSLEEALAHLDG